MSLNSVAFASFIAMLDPRPPAKRGVDALATSTLMPGLTNTSTLRRWGAAISVSATVRNVRIDASRKKTSGSETGTHGIAPRPAQALGGGTVSHPSVYCALFGFKVSMAVKSLARSLVKFCAPLLPAEKTTATRSAGLT